MSTLGRTNFCLENLDKLHGVLWDKRYLIACQFLSTSNNAQPHLGTFRGVVKHCWNSIKIGRHSPFGPLTHVDFVQFFQKSMGWHFAQALPELHGINVSQLSLHTVGFKFHYIFYTNSGKETYFTLECPLMPFSLELSEHVFSTKGFHTFFTRTF